MTMMPTAMGPVPTNLRQQMLERVSSMAEEDVVRLHELILLNEKIRVREEVSRQAEQERADGKWDNLEELIRAYRARRKRA